MKASTISITILLMFATMLFPAAHADSGQWVKYAGNPVLTPTPDSWDGDYVTSPRVIYDGSTFRMWYQGGFSGVSLIGYATSTDGINWVKHGTPVLTVGPSGAWDSSAVALGSVLWNGTTFQMWYAGTNGITYPGGAIGFATSTDGINWVKYSGNPVLIPTELGFDQKYIASPYVIRLTLTYNMWYTGRNVIAPKANAINRILYATSTDGMQWTKWPKPVLSPAADPSAWDSNSVYAPSVIWNGQLFGLWYSAINQSLLVPRIGFATSPDGATWTQSSSNPILIPGPPDTWDSAGVEQPSVVQLGKSFMMYYDGYSNKQGQRIGLALSPQGFAIAEFPAPTFDLFLGLITCATLYVVYCRRSHRTS